MSPTRQASQPAVQQPPPCSRDASSISLQWPNTTGSWAEGEEGKVVVDDGDRDGGQYDASGAMKFIITTVLVYSLLGISGLLLLRIRRRASRAHRTVTLREEDLQQYIKGANDLKMAGHRQKLQMDTSRMMLYLQKLDRQRSVTSNVSSSNDDSTTFLLTSVLATGHVRSTNSPEVHLKKHSSLLEGKTDTSWHASRIRTSLCKTCIALSHISPKNANTETSFADVAYSGGEESSVVGNVTEFEGEAPNIKYNNVLVSDL